MRRFAPLTIALSLLAPGLGCGDDGGSTIYGDEASTAAGGTDTAGSSGDEVGESSSDTGESETTETSSSDTSTESESESESESETTGEACAEIEESASVQPVPTDIVLAIDTSGTMEVEYTSVQNNLNALSAQIVASGVDAHVVLISSDVMCVDGPLGSGSCPDDSNEAGGYLHVMQEVGSNDSLERILDTHDLWGPFMRPNGKKHLVVVSDDDSYSDRDAFDATFKALGPEYEDYRFHAIVASWDVGDFGMCLMNPLCCALIVDSGDTYINLVNLTGGLLGDLCDQDFGPVFDALSTAVVEASPLPCTFPIPEPEDQVLDYDLVNVTLTLGGSEVELPRVDDPGACAGVAEGLAWHYDELDANDDPTAISLCPEACAAVQADEAASIAVELGCQTLIP